MSEITKEWFEKRAAAEGDLEIGAGKLPTYIPGFVPSEADRYYNGVIAGLHNRIIELEAALSHPLAESGKVTPADPAPQDNAVSPVYEIWGEVKRTTDGDLAVFSTRFNAVKARFTAGNSQGWDVGDKVYRLAALKSEDNK